MESLLQKLISNQKLILRLENKIQTLKDQLTNSRHAPERAQIEYEIQLAELALENYRTALSLEQKIS